MQPTYAERIAAEIQSIRAFDAIEREHISYTLRWVASGAPLCRTQKPDLPAQHLVAYFVLFDLASAKLLLVDHKNSGLWLPSGGHVEPGEHPKTTVRREGVEELSSDASFLSEEPLFLTISQTVGATAGHIDISLWYVLNGDSLQNLWFDPEEFHQIRWFALAELPFERADPHLQRFVSKLQRSFYLSITQSNQ